MRISCNGCRVLRKGCNQDCIIRPCLQWIESSESQANATLFLAKFYGRAGLINLIESGPDHLRPEIFKSLLYEACGRIVNPVDGSVGLMGSGNWAQCQAAVDAVLNGIPITHQTPLSTASASHQIIPPHKTYDIRHAAKEQTKSGDSSETQTGQIKRLAESINQVGECTHDTWQIPSYGALHGYGHFPLETVEARIEDQVDINEVGLELRLG